MMPTQNKRKKSWFKRILIAVIILLLIGAGIYWYIASEKFSDTSERKAAYTVKAMDFIHEFEKDLASSNKKYNNQIVTVNGTISEIELADTTMNIKITD